VKSLGKLGHMIGRKAAPKSSHRMAAEWMPFSWQWNDGTVSRIWG